MSKSLTDVYRFLLCFDVQTHTNDTTFAPQGRRFIFPDLDMSNEGNTRYQDQQYDDADFDITDFQCLTNEAGENFSGKR